MSGRMSRNKGKRAEYLLRDHFRTLGYHSDRVPLSGSSQGFKGDVTFSKEGKNYVAEIKSRKCSYTKIYQLYFDNLRLSKDDLLSFVTPTDKPLVNISTSLSAAMGRAFIYENYERHPLYSRYKRTFKKILNLQSLVGSCDVLVLKDNNMPLLFVRFL